ncbi:MAG: riboflavin synthase [Bacteroidia bacterium]|nr:riboflavin synthase [Bacteroidia bacterium]
MFSGIIEQMAMVNNIQFQDNNMILTLETNMANELYIDQSIAHNGACLTVTKVEPPYYQVVLIEETLSKTNFRFVKKGDYINIERSLMLSSRLDGHFVTGHVDSIGKIEQINNKNGSTELIVSHPQNPYFITVPKGSITINGISLTVVDSTSCSFSVHIIPYTLENTNIKFLKEGDAVNLEFDILAKYIQKIISQQNIKN